MQQQGMDGQQFPSELKKQHQEGLRQPVRQQLMLLMLKRSQLVQVQLMRGPLLLRYDALSYLE
jgi:hypothetical protein